MAEKVSTRQSVNKSVTQMVLSAMMLALAVLIDVVCTYIPGLSWPNGGTITLGMLPLFLAGLFCGPLWGFGVSLLFGVLDMLLGGAWGYNWASILLDYILGFGVCGVVGFFRPFFYQKKVGLPILGMSLAGVLRFLCSFFSGCIVMWETDSGVIDPHFDAATVTYSAVYNLGYILPCIILSILVFILLSKPLFVVLEDHRFQSIAPKSAKENLESFLPTLGMESFAPFVSVGLVIIAAVSLVPTIRYSYGGDEFVVDFLALAYIGLIFAFALLAYTLVKLVRSGKEATQKPVGTKVLAFLRNERTLLLATGGVTCLALLLSVLSLVLHYAVYAPLG